MKGEGREKIERLLTNWSDADKKGTSLVNAEVSKEETMRQRSALMENVFKEVLSLSKGSVSDHFDSDPTMLF